MPTSPGEHVHSARTGGPSDRFRTAAGAREEFVDESAVIGVAGHRHAARVCYLGLHDLQHRAALGAGIVASDGALLRMRIGRGRVEQVFDDASLRALAGTLAIGRVSGAPVASDELATAEGLADQPLKVRYRGGQVAVAMTGRFLLADGLRELLKREGAVFSTVSDAELLVHLLARSERTTFVNRLVDALMDTRDGGFAALVCTEDRLVAVRDPHGVRPLVLGRLDGATVVATDDGPLRLVGAEVLRELQPGEMLIAGRDGAVSVFPFPRRSRRACLREPMALARSDAHVFGTSAYALRMRLGQQLAKAVPCRDGEVVVGLPDAGVPAAIGFARAARLPYHDGLVRVGFERQELSTGLAELPTPGPWQVVPGAVEERSVVLVSASLVDGRGIRAAVALLRGAGATAVHLRVASPATRWSCAYGMVSPTEEELVANVAPDESALCEALQVASVGFLHIDELRLLVDDGGTAGWCDECLSGTRAIIADLPSEQLGLFQGD